MKKNNRRLREEKESLSQAREDSWAGGDNLESEIDYARISTGESNVVGSEFLDIILNKVMKKIQENSLKSSKKLREEFENPGAGRDLGYGEGEGKYARAHLDKIARYAQSLRDMLLDDDDLPEWVQEKITLSNHNVSTIYHYLDHKIKSMR